MSTASPIPETWELTGDDARETLLPHRAATLGHATRSCACARPTASVTPAPGVHDPLVCSRGSSASSAWHRCSAAAVSATSSPTSSSSAVPGPAGEVLTETVRQAQTAAATGQWVGLVFGLVGALDHGHHADGPDGTGPEPPLRRRARPPDARRSTRVRSCWRSRPGSPRAWPFVLARVRARHHEIIGQHRGRTSGASCAGRSRSC